jgi:ubiquinone/menaquinone biosynthesis C-methylase UbiE
VHPAYQFAGLFGLAALMDAGRAAKVIATAGLTAATAYLARRLRYAIDTRPLGHVPGAAAACEPAAARAQTRQDRSLPWRFAHRWLARFALAPFRRRPSFTTTRILVMDHGPGGVVASVAMQAPRDAGIVALDANAGMGSLARLQVSGLVRHGLDHHVGWVNGGGDAIPSVDASFDLVLTSGAMHSWVNPEAVLKEVRRVLKPDGRVVVIDTRRDLPTWAWVTALVIQRILMPVELRDVDEPSTSIRAGYRAQELEWFAARAGLPTFRIHEGLAWLILESGVTESDVLRSRTRRQP